MSAHAGRECRGKGRQPSVPGSCSQRSGTKHRAGRATGRELVATVMAGGTKRGPGFGRSLSSLLEKTPLLRRRCVQKYLHYVEPQLQAHARSLRGLCPRRDTPRCGGEQPPPHTNVLQTFPTGIPVPASAARGWGGGLRAKEHPGCRPAALVVTGGWALCVLQSKCCC